MPISREHNLVYIHVPKNSGTSIHEGLDMQDCRHHTWKYYYRKYHSLYKNGLTFAVVRNPWDRVVSAYYYSKRKESYWHSVDGNSIDGIHPDYYTIVDNNLSFEEVMGLLLDGSKLQGQGWRKQYPFIYNNNKLMVDRILRFEELPDCFDNLMQECNINVTLPQLNTSKEKRDYHDYHTKETKRIIREVYKKDIERFGYEY